MAQRPRPQPPGRAALDGGVGVGLRPADGFRPVVALRPVGADGRRKGIAAAVGVGRVDERLRQLMPAVAIPKEVNDLPLIPPPPLNQQPRAIV